MRVRVYECVCALDFVLDEGRRMPPVSGLGNVLSETVATAVFIVSFSGKYGLLLC